MMATAFLNSLITPAEGKQVQRGRLAAAQVIFEAASLEMSEGRKLAYEWVEGTTRDYDGTHKDGTTANPLTGLNYHWFEAAAQSLQGVCPLNVRKGYPEPTAAQLQEGIEVLAKWIAAAQVMPDIRLDADGELLRNRSWVRAHNHTNSYWLRTKITHSIEPKSGSDYLERDKTIGLHLGCEGGIHFRRTSVPHNNSLFCSGCGLRIIVDAKIRTYQELSNAWCSPRSAFEG
jgi:hypothetical protein